MGKTNRNIPNVHRDNQSYKKGYRFPRRKQHIASLQSSYDELLEYGCPIGKPNRHSKKEGIYLDNSPISAYEEIPRPLKEDNQ